MEILNRVFAPISLRSQASTLTKGLGFPMFGTAVTKAGQKVNTTSALTVGAFYNAINLITDDIAKLPKAVFEKQTTDQGQKITKLSQHPVNFLISKEPNKHITAYAFWKIIAYSAVIKGDGFARIIRNQVTGQPEELRYLDYEDVTVIKAASQLFYKYKGEVIAGDDMLHFYFFSTNGYCGEGIITYAANSIGITLASQSFMGETLGDKGLTHGVLETDQPVDATNKITLETAFKNKMSAGGAHNVALLDEGFKYKRIQITPQEAEFVANNREGIIAICQFLNVAPHKLKMLDQSNYSNLQLMTIEHQQDSVIPRVIPMEQELNRKLFTPAEKANTYIKFNLRSQLRGDQKSEAETLTKYIFAKTMTPNEARAMLELNPLPGGDELLQPVNLERESDKEANRKNDGK